MALLRLVLMAMGLGFLLSMGLFALTGNTVWRQRAMQILKWAVVAGLCVVGLFVLRRAAVFI
ncbi:MAG: hypothetical protein RLZZ369_672 [Pseudomonadota bacterium]|jgi:hypothetical protein|nr:hypothetical protein [Aquabacterium sp.]